MKQGASIRAARGVTALFLFSGGAQADESCRNTICSGIKAIHAVGNVAAAKEFADSAQALVNARRTTTAISKEGTEARGKALFGMLSSINDGNGVVGAAAKPLTSWAVQANQGYRAINAFASDSASDLSNTKRELANISEERSQIRAVTQESVSGQYNREQEWLAQADRGLDYVMRKIDNFLGDGKKLVYSRPPESINTPLGTPCIDSGNRPAPCNDGSYSPPQLRPGPDQYRQGWGGPVVPPPWDRD